MGTRGAFGFRFRGADKVTYNQFDSYPTGNGIGMFDLVRKYDDEQLAGAFCRIKLVDCHNDPNKDPVAGPELAERYGSVEAWWSLHSREIGSAFEKFMTGELDHMRDDNEFLRDSLFCEWAYIINIDERVLEVYAGFNKAPREDMGRYAMLAEPNPTGDNVYYGVVLLQAFPFDDVRALTDGGLHNLVEHIERSNDEEDDDE